MNFIVKNFLRGLAIVVPIALTVYVFYQLFIRIDGLVRIPIPGVGFVLTVLVIILVGVLTSNIVGRTIFEWTERLFVRAPFVKIVYSSIKDLIEAFVGDKKKFDRPVIANVGPGINGRMLGFVTRDTFAHPSLADQVMVYFPQSYNIAGNLLILPRSAVEPLDVEPSQVMALIVSGGVTGSL